MRTIRFNNELDEESVFELIKKIDSTINEEGFSGKIILYFSSAGGEDYSAETLIHYLNNCYHHLKGNLRLVATGRIFSNGLIIFYRYEGEKEILRSTVGMAHLSSITVNNRLQKIRDSETQNEVEEVKSRNIFHSKIFEKLFSVKEFKDYISGKDVYFTSDRLKEMFKL